jgi:hypothetical protein
MSEGDLPIGFIMSIAQKENALKNFVNLDDITKNKIVNYIKDSATGNDALEKINTSINGLEENNLDFLY